MTLSLKEKLYQAANNEGIEVFYRHTIAAKSYIIKDGDYFAMAVDRKQIASAAEEATLIGHELGHYYTGYLYSADTPLQTRGRCEYRANAWAYKAICPVERIKEAIKNNCENLWEIAEYLGLPEDFLAAAIGYYKGKGDLNEKTL